MRINTETALTVEFDDNPKVLTILIGNIVKVKGNFIGSVESEITGMVKRIEHDAILVDWSEQYNSRLSELRLDQIKDIQII